MTSILNSIVLLEGIAHLEDLSADEFTKTVETLSNKVITEKLDGANLWFGVDDKGLFTSREGKSPKKGRFYSVDDYPLVANYNGFRAAHLALEKVEPVVSKILQPDDVIEVEILFGRQPNTITYGHNELNYIVVLRGVNDTPEERINSLIAALENKTVKVESTIVSSDDGEKLNNTDEVLSWQFTKVKPIPAVKVDLKEVIKLLGEMKKWLATKNSVDTEKTNKEVLEISLGSIPKEKREAIKTEREKLSAEILAKYKNPIKDLLLNKLVRKVKPLLQAKDLDSSEDLGVEGVVLRDPVTGSQTKIVDKDIFTAINTFNSSVRNNVSGLVRTTNQDTSIDMRGGVFGQAKIRIADLMGAKELAMSSGVKRYVSKFKQKDAESTAAELATNLSITHVDSYKTKIEAVLQNAVNEINSQLEEFKKDNSKFKLQLKTGKEIQLTPEVIKKTLTAIAETKQEIRKIIAAVANAKNPTELVLALYGKTIQSLFEVEESVTKYQFIKSFEEASADTTSAPPAENAPEKKLLNGKIISARVRRYEKVSKFAPKKPSLSLIKSVNENWQHVDDMKFAADVDDKAETVGDPEFTAAKNNLIAGNITNASVTDYLDQATEMNDRVDTITFGLEMDDGQIVKVHVNAEQADQFETKLSELLGQEDDIENVINLASEKFDIVDVEWPEGFGPAPVEGEDSGAPEGDDAGEDLTTIGGEPEPGSEDDFEMEPDHDEEPSETEVPEDVPEDDEEDEEEGSEGDKPKKKKKDKSSEDVGTGAEEETEVPEDVPEDDEEDEEEGSEGDKPKKKKKKKKDEETTETTDVEESMTTFGEQFKQRLLEGKKKVKEDEKEDAISDEKIEDIQKKKVTDKFLLTFPTKQEKAIVTLMLNLGVSQKMLTPFKAELRANIEGPSDLYMKDTVFRTFVKKYLVAISTQSTTNEDEELDSLDILAEDSAKIEMQTEDNFLNRLSNSYQIVVYSVLRALGISERMVTLGQRQLLAGVRKYATLAQKNNDVRIYLFSIADHLGIDHKGILSVKKTQDQGEQDTIKTGLPSSKEKASTLPIKEDAAEASQAVSQLLGSLGIDMNASIPVSRQLQKTAAKTAITRLASNTMLLGKLETITQMVNKVTRTGAAPVAESKDEAFDYGGWTVGKVGSSGIFLSNDALNLKFDSSETEKLAYILEHNKKGSVKTKNGKDYVIIHIKHGEFTIKENSDSAVTVKLSSKDVKKILDLISEE